MAEKADKPLVSNNPVKTVTFTCKFCGEAKPLKEMIIIRNYFPLLTSCQDCAKSRPVAAEKTVES